MSPHFTFKPGEHADLGPGCLRRKTLAGLFLLAAFLASACTSMSGLDGGSEFKCKAPEGIPCQSVSGVHYNERAGNLPSQRAAIAAPSDAQTAAPSTGGGFLARQTAPTHRAAAVDVPSLGAIRSDPTIIRIWIAPWEDSDGDLNEQTYVYLQVDSGRWLIQHNRDRIRQEFTPVASSPRTSFTPTPSNGSADAPHSAAPHSGGLQGALNQLQGMVPLQAPGAIGTPR